MTPTGAGAGESFVAARGEFSPEGIFLNSASFGLPPQATLAAVTEALEEWRTGTADLPGYDDPVTRSRALFAELVGVDPGLVATANQASVFIGLVAASLPAGTEVLTAEGDFTSVLFPFLAQPGLTVREAPLEGLADAIGERTGVVAVAAVQSADGRIADLDAIREAASRVGARTLIDLTQAAGWLPVHASDFTWTVTAGYKWLLNPRGTAFLTLPDAGKSPESWPVPLMAGWYAAERPWDGIYGSPLRLAHDARRYDVSPAWHSWIGAAPALQLVRDLGIDAIHEHDLGLANRFRAACGLPAGNSAIVSAAVDDEVPAILERMQIGAAMRAGRLRLSFHLYNDASDADRAAEALSGHLS
ncbi:MAG: aminotransferase class V-fold PLP-dependent enzyme [Solirubrobacteraceae bacterium]|nr:aminotransferase class V-fold PLP-dependent enzyme [Solirubrobacteraceae bacterium]